MSEEVRQDVTGRKKGDRGSARKEERPRGQEKATATAGRRPAVAVRLTDMGGEALRGARMSRLRVEVAHSLVHSRIAESTRVGK